MDFIFADWGKRQNFRSKRPQKFRATLYLSPCTKHYKFEQNISPDNAGLKNLNDLNPGEVVYLSIIYNISDSWLNLMKCYLIHFCWHDSENQQLTIEDNVTILRELILPPFKEILRRCWNNPLSYFKSNNSQQSRFPLRLAKYITFA